MIRTYCRQCARFIDHQRDSPDDQAHCPCQPWMREGAEACDCPCHLSDEPLMEEC